MIRESDDGIWVELSETIAAHHEEVFMCVCSSSGLTRWFPISAEIDARPGGTLVLGWDASFKRKTTLAILDFDPGGHIVWDWYAAGEDRHAPVYWTVKPDVEQGSIVEMRQGPFDPDLGSMMSLASEAVSWQWRLCNLRSVLEARHDMRKVRPL